MNSTKWLPYDQTLDNYSRNEISNLLRIFLYTIPIVAIILSVVNFSLGFTHIAIVILSVPTFCGLSLIALNRGHINLSMITLISVLIAATTMSCVLGNGIHETGAMVLPVIVLFSSLVMNVRGVIITTATVILCVAYIVFGEAYGFYPVRNTPNARFLDLIVVLSVTTIHIFVTYNFSNITKNNLRRVKSELENQKRYRDEMKENLDEKVELLRLVHHRVKNNLLLINSLVELETIEDKEARKDLLDITESIHTIARAHDPLFHSEDYKQVAIKPYLEKMISTLSMSAGFKNVYADLQDGELHHEKALVIGMILQKILNQLLEPRKNELKIVFSLNEAQMKLDIASLNGQFQFTNLGLIELLSREIEGEISTSSKGAVLTFNR
ncbi:Histidine kinase [Ekhidna lutea]|uniref:histidine kinase n=1 Tax=Ekhidna lutea TaxID=447679 RepID=A0A239K690_EKHLU|nr:histidine kinase dimerization/phosphoacceptor domain -containing protein [Ekhidna lutea]SNT13202.1 Histidine kinase [Ekhidna lutea]